MNSKLLPFLGIAALACSSMACSSIRVVQMSPEGGEIALLGDLDGAMETAQEEMAATCGGPRSYQIVRQGEVVVGEVTSAQQQTQRVRTPFGGRGRVTRQTQVTQPLREWRVYYQCLNYDQPNGVTEAAAQSTHELRVKF